MRHHVAGWSLLGRRHQSYFLFSWLRPFLRTIQVLRFLLGVILRIPPPTISTHLMDATWITSMILREGRQGPPWLPEVSPMVSPPCPTTYSFRCPALTSCVKWSLKVLHCLVVCPCLNNTCNTSSSFFWLDPGTLSSHRK